MGLYFVFIDSGREVSAGDTALSVDVCMKPECDTSMLPRVTKEDVAGSEVCEDTVRESPVCLFGGLCDCETIINGDASTGCGGVYTTEQGNFEVNSVCAKSCGCPSTLCTDALPNTQACTVFELCDCETFVNHEQSEGCGGSFTTQFGPMPVNDFCAAYCDACPETPVDELIVKEYVERLEVTLKEKCRFSTQECRDHLHNAYSCYAERPGIEAFDETLRRATLEHAGRLALKYSKLGSPSLHRGRVSAAENGVVPICTEQEAGGTEEGNSAGSVGSSEDSGSSALSIVFPAVALVVAIAYSLDI